MEPAQRSAAEFLFFPLVLRVMDMAKRGGSKRLMIGAKPEK
jgi:hypothetical protein